MLRLTPCTQATLRRLVHIDSWSTHTLDEWLRFRYRPEQLRDTVSFYRLKALFRFLPTRRDNDFCTLDKLSPDAPREGEDLPLGHHMVILPDQLPKTILRPDGSSSWHAPPSPWTRRQWLGGKLWFSAKSPLMVGLRFVQKRIYLEKKETYYDSMKQEGGPPSVRVQQQSMVMQWHPEKTELVSEERRTEYFSEPYDPSQTQTSSLIPPQSGTLCFAFLPTAFMLHRFSSLCHETHRIHVDREYANKEGYPDLVVHVKLQLILILETLEANLPTGLSIRGMDYTIVNPLFAGSEIKIYMHWLRGPNKPGMPSQMASPDRTTRLEEAATLCPDPSTGLVPAQAPSPVRRQNPMRQERREMQKRVALLWTTAENGVAGIVAQVTLRQHHGPERVETRSWTMDTNKGYLINQKGRSSNKMDYSGPDNGDGKGTSTRNAMHSSQASTLSHGLREAVKFDQSGRPIMDRPIRRLAINVDRRWSANKEDVVALEKERLHRKNSAKVDAKSQELFERFLGDVD